MIKTAINFFFIKLATMNFLAHIYLSGANERIQIGNFMGDGIRGKNYKNYHPEIQTGVLLHRQIDTFTDAHPIFRQSKHRLVARYNHFSGIIVDMFYDHFLSKNWKNYSEIPLLDFTENFYANLEKNIDELNEKTKHLMPYIIKNNWLYNYQDIDYLGKILGQMDQRFSHPSKMSESIKELREYYPLFEEEFFLFFDELMLFSSQKLTEIIVQK